MARPPRDDEHLRNLLRKMGIDPDSVTVIQPKDPGGYRSRFSRDDNVIPFPKSGNTREKTPPFHRRGKAVPGSNLGILKLFDAINSDLATGHLNPVGAFCVFIENIPGTNDAEASYYHFGLDRTQQIGLLTEAAHDVMCGLPNTVADDTPDDAA